MSKDLKWYERLPLWIRTIAIALVGWPLTILGFIVDANSDFNRSGGLLILAGPVLFVTAIVLAVKELRARARPESR